MLKEWFMKIEYHRPRNAKARWMDIERFIILQSDGIGGANDKYVLLERLENYLKVYFYHATKTPARLLGNRNIAPTT